MADMFKKGVKCPLTIRFSTVGRETGSSDLARDPRGFSVKFKTTEGNWDFVANNTPVFFRGLHARLDVRSRADRPPLSAGPRQVPSLHPHPEA